MSSIQLQYHMISQDYRKFVRSISVVNEAFLINKWKRTKIQHGNWKQFAMEYGYDNQFLRQNIGLGWR